MYVVNSLFLYFELRVLLLHHPICCSIFDSHISTYLHVVCAASSECIAGQKSILPECTVLNVLYIQEVYIHGWYVCGRLYVQNWLFAHQCIK
jgi:hypothetical protein